MTCLVQCINSFLNNFPLDSAKLKEISDGNFEFDWKGRKVSKRIENAQVKGEIAQVIGKIAHCEQFLLFLQRFQEICATNK